MGWRGDTFLFNDDPRKAIVDYSEAIRINPLDVRAYERRIGAYAEMGHYDHAISDCDETIRIAPAHPLGFSLRAEICVCMGDYDKAIDVRRPMLIGSSAERGPLTCPSNNRRSSS